MAYKPKILALTEGGTNASLTASNGGILYSTASAAAVLAATSTGNQPLLSGASGAPGWSTATYPGSTTVSQILYSSAANTVSGLATANSAILATDASGVPSVTTASGNWLNTSRCAFHAYVSASVTNATGDGTGYTVIANTELFDQGSNYNNSTGVFTAPVTGKYIISVASLLLNIGVQSIATYDIVTTGRTYQVARFNPTVVKETNNAAAFTGTVIVAMTANDTMTFLITLSNSTKTVTISQDQTYISGFLLC